MSDLKEKFNAILAGQSMLVERVVVQKSDIKGRTAKDTVIWVRDLLSGKLFKAEWTWALDAKAPAQSKIEVMTKGIIRDISDYRAGKWGNR